MAGTGYPTANPLEILDPFPSKLQPTPTFFQLYKQSEFSPIVLFAI
jgi:hypothetical protein